LLADREPGERGEDVILGSEEQERPEPDIRGRRPDRQGNDQRAEQPVNEQRADPARHAGHRTPASFGETEVLAGVLWRIWGVGPPRAQRVGPIVVSHAFTVLSPTTQRGKAGAAA